MKKDKRDYNKIFLIVTLFLMPILVSFFIVILNNYEKFNSLFKSLFLVILISTFIVFVLSLSNMIKDNRLFNRNKYKSKALLAVLFVAFVLETGTFINFVYYNDDFKNWLITSSSSSIDHKGLADSIYSKYTINEVLENENSIEEELIDFTVEYNSKYYVNEYEKEIFDNKDGSIYKVIKISGTTSATGSPYVGYLTIVYDPSHIKLAKSEGAGTFEGAYGETLDTIAKKNNALVAINAGGFYDPNWNSNGGIPHGDVFINGVLDSSFARSDFGGGIIGFDKDNKLILKRMSTEEAIAANIRDAVDWGPYLIVNGVNQFKDSWSSWECGRTVIGQRRDGIVLLLVVDNLQEHSKGLSYKDAADIMEKYGAYNAANLDGGTSTMMVENGKYVNSPWNGTQPTYRWIPNAWIVVE